jgi:hypothetical protein
MGRPTTRHCRRRRRAGRRIASILQTTSSRMYAVHFLDELHTSLTSTLQDGPHACVNCSTHSRKCLTSKNNRLRRCLECRLRQAKCLWSGASAVATATMSAVPSATSAATPTSTSAPVPAPDTPVTPSRQAEQPLANASASSSGSPKSRLPNRLVAEVVVTPARRAKRKAQDTAVSGGSGGRSAAKRSMHLRSNGPVHPNEEEEAANGGAEEDSPLTSGASSSCRFFPARGS